MKSITSKLLAVLLLSAQGALTLHGMPVDKEQNYLDYLGNIPAPGVLTLQQRFDLDDKKQKAADAKALMPKKPSLMDRFAKIPEEIWKNRIVPYLGYEHFQVPIKPIVERSKNFSPSRCFLLENQLIGIIRGKTVSVEDLRNNKVLYERLIPEELKSIRNRSAPGYYFSKTGRFIVASDSNALFDLTVPDHNELWHMPEIACDAYGYGKCKFSFNDDWFAIVTQNNRVRVYDTKTKKICFEADGCDFNFTPNGRYIAVRSEQQIKFFDLTDKDHKQRAERHQLNKDWTLLGGKFSNDLRYFIFEDTSNASILVDLSSNKTWKFHGANAQFSPDNNFCILTIGKTLIKSLDRSAICIVIVDLKEKKEVANYLSEFSTLCITEANIRFSVENDEFYVHTNYDCENHYKIWTFNLSPLKSKKFRDSYVSRFDSEQLTLLMFLDEVKNENNGAPISLLHNVALKKKVRLERLQKALASFHPLVKKSIIEHYGIVDSTPEARKKANFEAIKANKEVQQKVDENKKFWMNIAKISGVSTLVAALGAWWYLKKK